MMQKGENIIFLKGQKVVLRPPRKSTDLELSLRWMNDPDVRQYLSVVTPITEAGESEWFDTLHEKKENIAFVIETIAEHKPIGFMGLHTINWTDKHAMTGAVIGEKDYWGKGYGTDAKMTILDYSFNTLNLRKIYSSAIAYNQRSIGYNLHCGYKITGRRRQQYFRKGRYWDEVLFEVFKQEWLPIWRKYQKASKIRVKQ